MRHTKKKTVPAAAVPTADTAEAAFNVLAAPSEAKVAKPAAKAKALAKVVADASNPAPDVPLNPEADSKAAKKVKDKDKDKEKDKKKKKKKKEAVVLRFEPHHLVLIDQRADGLGLSRAAWVRMVVAQVLAID